MLMFAVISFHEQLQDMSVKVTTEVAEVEASKTPWDEQGQARADTCRLTFIAAADLSLRVAVRYRGYIQRLADFCDFSGRNGLFYECGVPLFEASLCSSTWYVICLSKTRAFVLCDLFLFSLAWS